MSDRMDPWAAVNHEDDIDPWSVMHHEDHATAPAANKPAAKPTAGKPGAAPSSHQATTQPRNHESKPRGGDDAPVDLSPVVQAIAELSDDVTNALRELTAAIKGPEPVAAG